MRIFQDPFETRKRSFVSTFSICITVPLTEFFGNIYRHEDLRTFAYETIFLSSTVNAL